MGDRFEPIDTCPKKWGCHYILLTAAGSVVRAHWSLHDNGTGSAWYAATEGEHPNCWTDGICWEAQNADGEPSDPPVMWINVPEQRRFLGEPDPSTHAYKPHPKYPWFCDECGYAEHEPLKHGRRLPEIEQNPE